MKTISSLYIHFPFCKHLCNYCDFFKHKLENTNQVDEFETFFSKQLDLHETYLKENGYKLEALETLYIGGGTPSLWGERGAIYLESLFQNKRLSLKESCEFTVEVDPDAWNESEVLRWQSIGVNRFSIGSQAFSDKYISRMDRTHCLADVIKTVKYFSDRNLNYSVDLMLGLPDSETRDIETELRELLRFEPKHLSVYILKTRANYPLKNNLPVEDFTRDEYLKVSAVLKSFNYKHYEVSNFAREGFESKHNLKYWEYQSVAGLGPNATGLIVNDTAAIRYQWKSISLGVTDEKLVGSSLLIEKLFLGLRFHNGFDFETLFPNENKSFVKLYKKWTESGYLENYSSTHEIYLSALGYLMCDSLIDDVFKEIDF